MIPLYSFFKSRLCVGEKILCPLTPFACLSMFRLPKQLTAHPYCALAQHLLLQMHSLFIIPAFYAGAFSKKSTFHKIFLLINLSYTLPSSAERRAGDDRANSGTTPSQQKVLFVNICHRHWLSSARGFPRGEFLHTKLVFSNTRLSIPI